jgi:hypothetical protein
VSPAQKFTDLRTGHKNDSDAVDSSGAQLSDHHPIEVDWSYATAGNLALSDQFGGPHGTSYNDSSALPPTPAVTKLTIQTGNRVDHVETTLSNGYVFSHGGTGGTAQTLALGSGEYLNAVNLCVDQYQGHTRVFSIKFTTSNGRSLSGGTTSSSCTTYAAPSGWQIVGFHGRSGDEVDKLGIVYAPVPNTTAPARQPLRIINRTSALCIDVNGGTMADGTSVIQCRRERRHHGRRNQRHPVGLQRRRQPDLDYDDTTGMIRSMNDPHYCLDNSGTYGDGAQLIIWTCTGNNNQRFKYDAAAGTISVRSYPTEVISQNGTSLGNQLDTTTASGDTAQLWTMTP